MRVEEKLNCIYCNNYCTHLLGALCGTLETGRTWMLLCVQTGKTTVIRCIAGRETGITAIVLRSLIGPPLCQETSVSVTDDVSFSCTVVRHIYMSFVCSYLLQSIRTAFICCNKRDAVSFVGDIEEDMIFDYERWTGIRNFLLNELEGDMIF